MQCLRIVNYNSLIRLAFFGQAVRTHNFWKGACIFAGATLLAVGAPLLVAEGAAAVAAGAIVNGARIGAGAASVGASAFLLTDLV